MKKILFALVCLLIVGKGFGQTWTTYTTGNTSTKLCDNFVNCIAIDSQGNKWIGTNFGISFFNGVQWMFYSKDSLSGTYVYCITFDSIGNIWVGTDGGVSKFNGLCWKNYRISDGLVFNGVRSIAIDSHDTKWFGTDGGLSKYNDTTWTNFTIDNGLTNNSIRSISIDKYGNKWIGTNGGGVSMYNDTVWKTFSTSNGLANNRVSSIIIDKDENKWVGTLNGISKLDSSNLIIYGSYNSLSNNNISCLAIDTAGVLWCGTHGGGLFKLSNQSCENLDMSDVFSDNNINCFAFEKNGNRWLGNFGKGVCKYNSFEYINYSNNGINANACPSIAIDKFGNKWFGGSGVSVFNGIEWKSFTTKDGLVDNSVNDIISDIYGNIWIATYGGLSKYDGTYWSNYTISDGLPNNDVQCISVDFQNNIWIGTYKGGIAKFDGTVWTKYKSATGLASSSIKTIAIDQLNNKWFGTSENGIMKFDNNTWKTYKTYSGLIDDRIWSIVVDKNNNKWIGTMGGISLFNDTVWHNYTTSNGLTNNSIVKIIIDSKGVKWIETLRGGVIKFDGDTWTTYTDTSGLAHNTVWSLTIDAQGNKWFTTMQGVSVLSDGGAGPLIFNKIIGGFIFNDINQNGIKDADEQGIANQIIKMNGIYTSTNNQGYWASYVQNGNCTMQFSPQNYWHATTDTIITLNITDSTNLDTLYNLGVYANTNINNIAIYATGNVTRANFSSHVWLDYKNLGTSTQNGFIAYTPDLNINIISSTPPADSVSGKTSFWKYDTLAAYEHRQINIELLMPGVSYLGDTLVSTAQIIGLNPDIDTLNNTDTLRQVLTGSYDPNDKQVVPTGVLDEHYVLFNTPLTYTIRFQNTGTDTAFNVNIVDTISNSLRMETLEILASSHPVQLEMTGTNKVTFRFQNIQLPDSNVNQIGSNGFVKFKISPKANLPENTLVENTGYIYFDFNPAIITNTTFNTYVSVIPTPIITNIVKNNNSLVKLYPNPFSNETTLSYPNSGNQIYSLTVTDIQGRIVIEKQNLGGTKTTISSKGMNKGMYFYNLRELKGEEYKGKMIIE